MNALRLFRITVRIFCPVILLCITATAQSCHALEATAATSANQTDYRAALEAYGKAKECFLAENNPARFLLCMSYEIDCLMKLSAFHEMQEALTQQAAYINTHTAQLTEDELARVRFSHHTFQALSMKNAGDVDASVVLLRSQLDSISAISTHKRTTGDSARICNLHLYLSEAYQQQGNFESAKTHAYEAVQLARQIPGMISTGVVLRPLITLAESQFNAGSIAEAEKTISYLKEVIHSVTNRRTERAVQVAQTIFNIYLRSGKPDSARIYLERLRKLDTEHQYLNETQRLSGEFHLALGHYDRAEQSFRLALRDFIRNKGERTEACAVIYSKLGALRLRGKAYDEAAEFFHTGIYLLSGATNTPDDLSVNPAMESLFSQRLMLDLLDGKTHALLRQYQATGSRDMLDAARNVSRLAIAFLSHLRNGYAAESDRSVLTEHSYPVYEHALEIVHTYYTLSGDAKWLDTAFVLMEESKALNLRDAVLHVQARRFAGIPDSLLQLEQSLKLEIAGKEELIRTYRASPFYQPEVEFGYRNELTETRRRFRQLLEIYEKNYPRYYALKHKPANTSSQYFREFLRADQILLEYFVGDSVVFLLVIGHEKQDLIQIAGTAELQSLVAGYRNALLQFPSHKDTRSLEAYVDIATKLYGILIPESILPGSDLLIVPDGVLGYLSFAGLLEREPDTLLNIRSYDFMLWHHEIAYSYSANLYLELQDSSESHSGSILVCAPDFRGLDGIPALPFNQSEASQIRRITGGSLLTGTDCTVPAFRRRLSQGDYSALHLATHGSANDTEGDSSFLVFSGQSEGSPFLFVYDLYNMDLNIPLVYLSSCETGTGELQRGEGMISLARGFFYAGVKGLVTTLWRLDDQRANEISALFYQNLQHDMRKDEALSGAQRTYIETLAAKDALYAHPVYWSAIIPVGNMNAVVLNGDTENPVMWYFLLGAVVVVLGVVMVRRQRARQQYYQEVS